MSLLEFILIIGNQIIVHNLLNNRMRRIGTLDNNHPLSIAATGPSAYLGHELKTPFV